MATKAKKPILEAEERKLTGRKVKSLRQKGLLPANVYGKKIKSVSIQAEIKSVEKIFAEVGETGLVDLKVKGEKETRPVLLHNPQFHPVSDSLIHLDFYQVDLTQKVTADVSIELTGESPAVEKGEGILVQLISEVEVEALPTDLPEKFILNISKLEKIDDAVTVENLKSDEKVKINAEKDQIIAKITEQEEEIIEEKPAETEESVSEGAESQAPTDQADAPGEEKTEEKPAENNDNKDQGN
jgi:large subunit ribosomal protein L25